MTVQQTDGYTSVDASVDPDLANKIAAFALSEETKAPEAPSITNPPDGDVTLPGGLMIEGVLVTSAEVRELNGEDEEELAKPAIAADFNRFVDTLLNRCVVRIGEHRATPALLEQLLLGDRDALLQAVRVATFGDKLKLQITCNGCAEEFGAEYSFAEDVRVQVMEDMTVDIGPDIDPVTLEAGKVCYQIPLRDGRSADVRLVSGEIQKHVYNRKNANLTGAALNTLILDQCVITIDDEPMTMGEIRRLGTADRMRLLKFLEDSQHGPRWDEVKVACPSCERQIPVAIDVNIMFRGA